jgi:2-(1,2-epoxy-1,2-dihydrophenyl)acetyl-CoA isomerase
MLSQPGGVCPPGAVIAKRGLLLENIASRTIRIQARKESTMTASNPASEKVLVDLQHGIKRITINRPERRNALDTETFKLLRAAIEESAADDSKVIILTGAGEAFCAGADLQARLAQDISKTDVTTSLRENTNPTIEAMRSLPKPIIARVHGPAVGVGCNYALACDIIIASDQAKFGQVFVKIGLAPDGGGTYFLPRMVGYHKAFELMATGEIITSHEALRLGIINRVVAVEELDSAVDELAQRLAESAAISIAAIKAELNYAMNADLSAALDFEAVNQGDCFRSEDFAEGVAAFLQKRKPVFQGK